MGAIGMLTGKTCVEDGGKVVVVEGVDDGEAKGKCRARVSLAADSGANRRCHDVTASPEIVSRICHPMSSALAVVLVPLDTPSARILSFSPSLSPLAGP